MPTFTPRESKSISSEPTNSSLANSDRINADFTNPHNGGTGNGTSKSLAGCKSTWKLNGKTFHNCTSQVVKGKCICAIEIEPSTRFKMISIQDKLTKSYSVLTA